MYRSLTETEEQLLEEVSQTTLMNYTRETSKEVRLSGSAEELRAFQYAQQLLKEFGIATELYLRDSYISLPISATLSVGNVEFPCITHSMSVSVKDLSAPVVSVGSGTQEEYAASDVRGKIVVVTGLANPATVNTATEAGAVGAIFISLHSYTHEMIITPVWGMPTLESATRRPSIPVVSVTAENGQKIRDQIAQTGDECCCVITTVVDTGIRPIPTLIAEIPGSVEPDKFVLFSGHIDSWHYGSMDNGTANATMLEVARILAKHKGLLRRSIRLAFWSGHSHGRYAGSTWYCDEHWEDLRENCYLHVNIDSVGAKTATVLTQSNCMAETKGLAADAIAALTGQVYEGQRMTRMGDQSFWGTGTPSLFVSVSEQPEGGLGWWWHTTEDTMDKVEPDYLVRDCKIYLLILYRTLTDTVFPLDLTESADDVCTSLDAIQQVAGKHLDLTVAVNRAQSLRSGLADLIVAQAGIDSQDTEIVAAMNRCIREVLGQLVPLNYVSGSTFDHDPALNQPPIPKLKRVAQLAAMSPSTEDYYFLRASLRRQLNEVQWTLKCAQRIVAATLQQVSQVADRV